MASVGGTALQQHCVTSVTDAYGLGRRRQHQLHVGTLVAEDLATVSTVMLSQQQHNNVTSSWWQLWLRQSV